MQVTEKTMLKGYHLQERIGAGGFGAVYRAKQSTINREVAIKIILPNFANNPDFIRRFESEAYTIARLEHPHIIPLIDYWRDTDGAYLVMRYLRGGSVRDALQQEGPYELVALSQLLNQIASALDFAHRNHVIHRDIKPGNILLDEDGNAYLSDFGIAKDLEGIRDGMTDADAVVGSLDYISPEQARSEPVTPRTDIYSLGVTLYEMITGKHPFREKSSIERLYKHINDPLPDITGIADTVCAEINAVIAKATAKDPDKRYADVLALAVAFQDAIGRDAEADIVEQLTLREQEILAMIVDGMSNREIAEQLVVTVGTVKWHIRQLYSKLGVRSRVQAIVRARDLNLVVTGTSTTQLPAQSTDGPMVISLPEPENPYKGLHAFQTADARDFFGREELTEKLIGCMQTPGEYQRFLAVVGPSGSGKSSLVRAGLIPKLWCNALPGSEKWFIVDMIPGDHPLDKLEIALMRVAANQAQNLRDQLQRDERGLIRVADLILPGDDTELVIIVDQFEEVFTLVEDETERQHFLKLLRTAVSDKRSRVRVVVTLRADYYDRPLLYPEFGELIRSRMETVLPLSPKGLERAIRGPAERVGVVYEQGLVEQIVSEMNYQAGALPLLQYALTELFDRRREGRLLTHRIYDEIGGAVGALANRAEEIYRSLTPEGQELSRQMFMRLVSLGEGAEDIRRRATQAELLSLTDNTDLMEEIIEQFAAYRLLLLDHDPETRQPTVEVAHEAILREWTLLNGWINDSRTELRLQRQLARLVADWKKGGRDASYLLRGARLNQFESWSSVTRITLTPDEKQFLEASLDARAQQEAIERVRRQNEAALERRARRLFQGLTVALLFAALGGFGLSVFAFDREHQAEVARENEQVARAEAENSLQRTNAQRLGLEAMSLAQINGDPELIALLALRSVSNRYTPQGDFAIQAAMQRQYPAEVLTTQSVAGNRGLALSPDGTRLAVGGLDDTTTVWDLETGTQIGQFAVGDRVAFLPDGEHIVTANRVGALRVWHIETGEMLHARDDLGEMYTRSMVVWEARNAVVLGSGHSELLLLDLDTWEEQTRYLFTERPSNVWDLFVANDGESLAVITSNRLSLLDAAELALIGRYGPGEEIAQSGAVSPDGRYAVVGTGAGRTWIWAADDPETPLRIIDGVAEILEVAFSPDGAYILTSGSDTQVRFWDVTTGLERRPPLVHAYTLETSIFSDDGAQIITTGQSPAVRIWDAEYENPVPTYPSVTAANHHAYSADGHYLAAVRMNMLTIHDRETGMAEAYQQPGMVMATAASHDARYILVGTLYDATIRFFDLVNQTMLEKAIPTGLPVTTITVSQDNRYIAGAGWGPFHVWDFETGEVVFSDDLQDVHWGIDISRDGTLLLVATATSVRLYDTASWQPVWTSSADESGTAAMFAPDGRTFVIGGNDGTLRLWDVETFTPLREFSGHYGGISTIDFSSDGTRLVSGSKDGTTRIWDVATGEELRRFTDKTVSHVLFSPDGDEVLIDDTIDFSLWPVDINTNVDYLCQQITRDFTPQERLLYEIDTQAAPCPGLAESESS